MIDGWFDLSTLVLFVSASLAIILAPGPASIYVLSKGVSGGYRSGFPATFGTCSGLLVHTTAAVLGLSAILRASATAYTTVKLVGAAYLIYLGIETLRSEESFELGLGQDDAQSTTLGSYRQGVIINTLNPKVAVFFLAFLPQFVDSGAGPVRMLFLGVLYTSLAFCYQSSLVLVSGKVRSVLSDRSSITDRIKQLTGVVLVGFGIELVIGEYISG